MSDMYKAEVPLYADLIDIVTEVNSTVIFESSISENWFEEDVVDINRLTLERHGAIRLGTPQELKTVGRLFSQLGMFPVGYYDLSIAGLPMHATAFRPTDAVALEKNPFRVFTTLLRPELLSEDSRRLSQQILQKRNIFTDRLLELLDEAESHGGLCDDLGDEFVQEALQTFQWHTNATATYEEYISLKHEHSILADVASFPNAHINHLTPRTLDIDMAQTAMQERGLAIKDRIEGPPFRKCQILLRQTSFKALEENVNFRTNGSEIVRGVHTARFGEIEQRGAALTAKGRKLYDDLLLKTTAEAKRVGADAKTYDRILSQTFACFPDSKWELQAQGLIYCSYHPTALGLEVSSSSLPSDSDFPAINTMAELLCEGLVEFEPVTYEDFLPFSAAGIFQSNLGSDAAEEEIQSKPDPTGFEKALGRPVYDMMDLYAEVQRKSLDACRSALGMKQILL
jgi:uncharacterized glyoxalase superfamily metalloenzyme YdcJ